MTKSPRSHAGPNRPSAFGALLTRYRKRRGWTQEQLAQEVHVSRETISHLETGKIVMPEWTQLHRIVHKLKIPGTTLLRSLDLIIDENEAWLSALDGGQGEAEAGERAAENDNQHRQRRRRLQDGDRPAERGI